MLIWPHVSRTASGPFFGGPRFRSPPSPQGPGPILLSLSRARGARRPAPVQPGDGPAGAAAPRARGRRTPRVAPKPGRGFVTTAIRTPAGADTPAGQASCCPPWAPNGAPGRKASLRSAGGRRAAPSAALMRVGGGIKPAGRAAERRAAGRLLVSATRSGRPATVGLQMPLLPAAARRGHGGAGRRTAEPRTTRRRPAPRRTRRPPARSPARRRRRRRPRSRARPPRRR